MNLMIEEHLSVFRIKPEDFSPLVEVAACYIEYENNILFLKRAEEKSEGGKWGVPAGKIEKGEDAREGVIRETFEETGIVVNDEQLIYLGKIFIRKPKTDYVYHMFHNKSARLPEVILNHEHQEYRWLSIEKAPTFPLMAGGLESLQHFKALANKPQITRKPFYFIRHGETDVNADPEIKRVDYDLPLNQKGRIQAQMAREALAKIPLNSVCFSPLQRAVETKDILLSTTQIEQIELDDLTECKAKIWTKMVYLENKNGYEVCDEIDSYFARVMRGIETALQTNSPTLIVAHGGIHWALCYLLSIKNHPWKIGNCQLVHFRPVGDLDWEAISVCTK